ncbi:hypothetical protein, partial [Klebsiella pneumoniae]|uniref:hypothetical protein n=1 Tax=Klebsiella pneumoniae TaxID=573 RepID=UPI003CFE12C5
FDRATDGCEALGHLPIDLDHPQSRADRRFLVAGFIIGVPQPISFTPQAGDLSHIVSAPFAIGLVFVMYSFSGWNAATYIIGEMKTPQQS